MKEVNWSRTSGVIFVWQGVLAIAVSVMVGGIVGIMGKSLPSQIPLFYSQPWGEEQLAAPWQMVWPVGISWIAWGISWISSRLAKENILSTFVAGTGLVSQFIILLGLVRIVMIVI